MARRRRPRKSTPADGTSANAGKRLWTFQDDRNLLTWAFAVLALLAGVYAFDSRLSLSGDNAEFIVLGRSIAEGHGLTYINTPDLRPATKFPFGFPLLLSLVQLLVPNSILSMKLLVLFAFVAAVPLLYRYLRPASGRLVASLVSVMTLTCFFILDYSHQVMSEIPYLCLSVVALLALSSALRQSSTRNLALAVLAVMAAYYVRTVGLALIAAGIVGFGLERRFREAGMFFGGCVLLALPWQIRTAWLGGESYATTWLFRVDPYRPDAGEIGWLGLLERIVENAKLYILRELPVALFPAWITEKIPLVLGVAAGIAIAWFIAVHVLRRRLPGIYLAFYLGACFLWPPVWTDVRLLAPVLPFIFLAFLAAVRDASSRIGNPQFTRVALVALALAVVTPNVQALARMADEERRYAPDWAAYFESARWLEQNTDKSAVIGCRKAFLMSVIADRRTTSYAFTEDFDAVLASLVDGGADYVVVDQLQFNSTGRYLVPTIERHRSRFELVHIVRDPDTYILRLD